MKGDDKQVNKKYGKYLSKGISIAKGVNGDEFMRVYKEMTADFCHRRKQKVTVRGIFAGAEVMK